mmetsp:Transcript_4227/g.15179  ORF Transcript_4227/g.15179 Transcript_4227/m.15179 type:complete len:557 (-) Transcript_4227:224-1894(-)
MAAPLEEPLAPDFLSMLQELEVDDVLVPMGKELEDELRLDVVPKSELDSHSNNNSNGKHQGHTTTATANNNTASTGSADQAVAAELPEGMQAWRCVDSTHDSQTCTKCTPPPPLAEEAKYVLVNQGEKKLRTLLRSTPEWRSPSARAALAEQLETQAQTQVDHGTHYFPSQQLFLLAKALRDRDVTPLRKSHMLLMCRKWGFKSECWQPRERQRELARANSNKHASTEQGQQACAAPSDGDLLSPKHRAKRQKAAEQLEKKLDELLVGTGQTQLFHPLVRPSNASTSNTHWIDDHNMLASIKKEFFDILVPQLQRSTLALLKSPESVACLTGVLDKAPPDRLIEDRERVVMAEKGVTNTAKAVIDTCLRTGDCAMLFILDPVQDMDSLCKLYYLIRVTSQDVITAERTRLMMGYDELFEPRGNRNSQSSCDHLVRNTLAIMLSHVQFHNYLDEKGRQHADPARCAVIKMSMGIETMVVLRMELLLRNAIQVCRDTTIMKQIVIDVLEIMQMIHSSKDLMFANTQLRLSKQDSLLNLTNTIGLEQEGGAGAPGSSLN